MMFLSMAAGGPASATPPLPDQLLYDNERVSIDRWLALPFTAGYSAAMGRHATCSAIGGPRGVWAIENSKLWLAALHVCGGSLRLQEVYPGAPEPWHATWVSGKFTAQYGDVLCWYVHRAALFRHSLAVEVVNGEVRQLHVSDNSNHPNVPDAAERVAQLREMRRLDPTAILVGGDYRCGTSSKR